MTLNPLRQMFKLLHLFFLFFSICSPYNNLAQVFTPPAQVQIIPLPQGTPVTLRLEEDLLSNHLQINSIVPLSLALDVVSQGHRVAATGSYAEARVRQVTRPRPFGKSGLLELEVVNLQMVDGQRIQLGGKPHRIMGKNRRMLAWAVALAPPIIGSVFASSAGNNKAIPFMIPFVALGFLVKGKEAKFPAESLFGGNVYRGVKVQVE